MSTTTIGNADLSTPAAVAAFNAAPLPAAGAKPGKVCPITRQDFLAHAEPLPITIGTTPTVADAREFSTGSFGYGFSGKVNIKINGVMVLCQVSMNVTAIGSKPTA